MFFIYVADLQWKTPHDFGAENYMMPMVPPAGYNSYWNGMQPMDGFMAPYGNPMQMMGYGLGPLDMPFGGMPQDPFGMQGYMMPGFPPHRYIFFFFFWKLVCSFKIEIQCFPAAPSYTHNTYDGHFVLLMLKEEGFESCRLNSSGEFGCMFV